MKDVECLAANVARLRRDRQLTQAALAEKAGLSRVALGKIERAAVVPRARTLADLAQALEVPIGELVTPVPSLARVRFRARARIHGREQILAEVAQWLSAYADLEAGLAEHRPFRFRTAIQPAPLRVPSGQPAGGESPVETARAARSHVGLSDEEPVRDICGLLEENGVKLLLLEMQRDSFFGLSVSEGYGGPAVVVNTWDRISVERWIFTAAHELGHLLLHPAEYRREATDLPEQTEREADTFASHFLMPEPAFAKEWDETRGHSLLTRVLKVKRIFRVSYKTVLYRLVQSERQTADVWRAFQRQHNQHFGKTLRNTEEPLALTRSEFAWQWNRSGEPERLSTHDFVEDRLAWLVRNALERQHISLGRAAEILGLAREEMRKRTAQWAT